MEFYRPPRRPKGGGTRPKSYRNSQGHATAKCADCGAEFEVPFVPRHGRPVYCKACFGPRAAHRDEPPGYKGSGGQKGERAPKYKGRDPSRYGERDAPRRDRATRYRGSDAPKRYSSPRYGEGGAPKRDHAPRYKENDTPKRYSSPRYKKGGAPRYKENDAPSRGRAPRYREGGAPKYRERDAPRRDRAPRYKENDAPKRYSSPRYRENDAPKRYSSPRGVSRYGERDTPKYRERGAPRRDRATKYRERNTAKMERAPRQESRGEDRTEFYNSLRSRLFGVLGRSCCMCGFGDERALGFGSKDDARIFDTVRRGGAASSWGRYVSKPDMARAELQVLCLNCNQLRQD